MCEPDSGAKTIKERGSNKFVAIANKILAANMALCGKKIVITHTTTKKGETYSFRS